MTSGPARALKRERQPKSALADDDLRSGIHHISPLAPSPPTLAGAMKTTEEAMGQIRLRKMDAEKFLQTCKSNRKKLGNGYFAELTKANTIISLADALENLFQKASGTEDVPALLNIGIAARMFAVKIQREGFLRMETYPEGDTGRAVADSMISNAQALHNAVRNILGSFPEALGVRFPPF